MRFFRFWLGRHLMHLGLNIWPDGPAKRELVAAIEEWSDTVGGAIALAEYARAGGKTVEQLKRDLDIA